MELLERNGEIHELDIPRRSGKSKRVFVYKDKIYAETKKKVFKFSLTN